MIGAVNTYHCRWPSFRLKIGTRQRAARGLMLPGVQEAVCKVWKRSSEATSG